MTVVKLGILILVTGLAGFVAGWLRDPGLFVADTVMMFAAGAIWLTNPSGRKSP